MISYADFEFAIERWKSRAAGVPQPTASAASGTVADEVPVSTAPEDLADTADEASGLVESRAPASDDAFLGDASLENPATESDPR